MHCNGECFLAKEKQDAEKQNQQSNNDKKDKFEIQPFFLSEVTSINHFPRSVAVLYSNVKQLSLTDYTHTIFHPPSDFFCT